MTNSERTLRKYFIRGDNAAIVSILLILSIEATHGISFIITNPDGKSTSFLISIAAIYIFCVVLLAYAFHLTIKIHRNSLQQLADHQYLANCSTEELQDSLTELEQRLETQRSHIDGLVAERDRLRTEYDKATADIENQISDIRGEISDIQKEIDIRQQLLKAHSKT